MIKRTRFSRTSRASLKQLIERCEYIQDASDPNHVGKIIHPPLAHGCGGIGVDDFLSKALDLYGAYERGRSGKKGNRTTKLFEEFIYSSPENSWLAPKERALIRRELLDRLFPNVPALPSWHEDPVTGRCDLHILTCAYTDSDPPLVYTSAAYGNGKKHILLEMERAEDQVLLLLNRKRARERWILSARETRRLAMAKAGKKTLAQRLAKVWDGKRETLKKALRKLGYFLVKMMAKTVQVALKASSRPRRYVIATLQEGRLAELKALAKERLKPRDPEIGEP